MELSNGISDPLASGAFAGIYFPSLSVFITCAIESISGLVSVCRVNSKLWTVGLPSRCFMKNTLFDGLQMTNKLWSCMYLPEILNDRIRRLAAELGSWQ